ncbi:MAG TPA: aminopeptidase P family protein, partial [Candidatus Atribacteria bacterium]|nr:aminopeptidase P family protein [Candidatus Atribacteria bacterium]
MINQIPQYEFTQRVKTLQEKMIQEKLDIIITFGDEAEPQYVRYFSDYWPSFESAGVFIPKTGEPSLLIGPESYTFSKAWSKIPRILKLKEYRESSEPEYPGVPLTTFTDLFNEVIDTSSFRRIGIVGYPLMPTPVYEAITKTAQDFRCEVVRAEKLIIGMKQIKSETEIEIMHNAYNISQKSFANVLKKIQPGMSEIEVVAESEYFIRKFGAENEAYPMWCISGENTTHAIARPTHKKIQKGEMIQIQVGARLGGYASSIGRPVVFGPAPQEVLDLMKIGLEARNLIVSNLKAGIEARKIDTLYREFLKKNDALECMIYGPCHG